MIFLRVIFIAQLVLILPAFAMLLVTPVHLGTVATYFYLAPVGLLAVLYAAWQFAGHPERRPLAAATAATPIVCLGVPAVLYWQKIEPVAPAVLVLAAISLLVIGALVLLGSTDQWRGTGVLARKRFNLGYLIALGVLLLMLWFPIIGGLAANDAISLPTDIGERDRIIRAAALYLIAVAAPALCLSLFALLYAPVGLVRNRGGRILHLGQLIIAFALLGTLTAVTFAISVFMFNPG